MLTAPESTARKKASVPDIVSYTNRLLDIERYRLCAYTSSELLDHASKCSKGYSAFGPDEPLRTSQSRANSNRSKALEIAVKTHALARQLAYAMHKQGSTRTGMHG